MRHIRQKMKMKLLQIRKKMMLLVQWSEIIINYVQKKKKQLNIWAEMETDRRDAAGTLGIDLFPLSETATSAGAAL